MSLLLSLLVARAEVFLPGHLPWSGAATASVLEKGRSEYYNEDVFRMNNNND